MRLHRSVRTLIVLVVVVGLGYPASAIAQDAAPAPTSSSGSSGSTRLLFSAGGRSLPKGDSYFGLTDGVVPFYQVGLTDRFSLGFGSPVVTMLGGYPVAWLTPKYQVLRRPEQSVAVGVVQLIAPGAGGSGLAYVASTFGSANDSVSISGVWAYGKGVDDFGAPDAIIVGGEHRSSPRVTVVTENYITRFGFIPSVGVRIAGRKNRNISTELIGVFPMTSGGILFAPVVNVVWQLGR
jgi:hypothetical protein